MKKKMSQKHNAKKNSKSHMFDKTGVCQFSWHATHHEVDEDDPVSSSEHATKNSQSN